MEFASTETDITHSGLNNNFRQSEDWDELAIHAMELTQTAAATEKEKKGDEGEENGNNQCLWALLFKLC